MFWFLLITIWCTISVECNHPKVDSFLQNIFDKYGNKGYMSFEVILSLILLLRNKNKKLLRKESGINKISTLISLTDMHKVQTQISSKLGISINK